MFAIVSGITAGANAEDTIGFNPKDLVQATNSAMEVFVTTNESHLPHMTGFKTWKSGSDAKVKFYINHDGMAMEYNYLCMKHDTEIHCTAQ